MTDLGPQSVLHQRKKMKSGLKLSKKAAAAWYSLRMDADPLQWLLVKPEKKKLKLACKGNGDYAELVSNLGEDEVLFGVFAFRPDGGDRKFAFISSIGERVAGMARASAGMTRAGAQLLFEGTVCDVACIEASDAAPEVVEAKIAATLHVESVVL